MLPHLPPLRRMSMSMPAIRREPPPRISTRRSAVGLSSRRRRSVSRRTRVSRRSRRSGGSRRSGIGASEPVVAVFRSTELETPQSRRFSRASSSSPLVVARSRKCDGVACACSVRSERRQREHNDSERNDDGDDDCRARRSARIRRRAASGRAERGRVSVGGCVRSRVGENGEVGIHEGSDLRLDSRLLVERRVGVLEHRLESVDVVGGNVGQVDGQNRIGVAVERRRLERFERDGLDLIGGDSERVGESSGRVGEDLSGGVSVRDEPSPRELLIEENGDEGRVDGLEFGDSGGGNDLRREIGREGDLGRDRD